MTCSRTSLRRFLPMVVPKRLKRTTNLGIVLRPLHSQPSLSVRFVVRKCSDEQMSHECKVIISSLAQIPRQPTRPV